MNQDHNIMAKVYEDIKIFIYLYSNWIPAATVFNHNYVTRRFNPKEKEVWYKYMARNKGILLNPESLP